MKRLVITGPRTASFDDVPVPECPPDGLLVKAIVTAISTGTELRVYRQVPIDDAAELLFPSVPLDRTPHENDYSMVGRVVEVGADVVGFSEGDRVFVSEPHKEYASVSADSAMKLPDAMPDHHAVFLNILGVGQLALRTGHPTPGENVAVVGMGVIGLGTLALCRALGFRTAGIDTDTHRLGVAEEMGADLAADPTTPELAQRISGWSDGRGADLVIEAASTWQATKTGHGHRPYWGHRRGCRSAH